MHLSLNSLASCYNAQRISCFGWDIRRRIDIAVVDDTVIGTNSNGDPELNNIGGWQYERQTQQVHSDRN